MAWGDLPSLGFGGSFSAYTPPTDWGAVINKGAEVLKMGLDIRQAIRAPQNSPLPPSGGTTLERNLTQNESSGNNTESGLSTPVILIGGGLTITALFLVLKK